MEAGNFSFFTVGAIEPTRLKDLKVDENGEPIRKRQQHRKSRNGCANCKKRKVKCDELKPSCLNCQKRGYDCNILRGAKPRAKSPAKSETSIDSSPQTASPLPLSPIAPEQLSLPSETTCQLPPLSPWNLFEQSLFSSPTSTFPFPSLYEDPCPSAWSPKLLRQFFSKQPSLVENEHGSLYTRPPSMISSNLDLILRRSLAERELIQHFEDVTSKYLAMSPTIWGTKVLYAAMHQDYLMSAIMLMAAVHINDSLPKNDPQRRPVLYHFGNALSGLRIALAEPMTLESLDSIISCSLLLMQYSWVYMEISPLESLNIADMFYDTVTLFNGLKSCLVASKGLFTYSESAWSGVLGYSPRITLEEYNRIHKARERLFFGRIHHPILCGLGTADSDCCSADNVSAMQRLSIVLCAIEIAGDDLEGAGIATDVYRYLMTWPPFCTNGFLQQLRDKNPASLCILIYYFAAIVRVSCDRIWWMRDRALYMYTLLRQRLEGRCEFCTGPAIELVGNTDKGLIPWNGPITRFEE